MKNILKSRSMVLVFPLFQILITLFLYNQLPSDMPMQVSLSGSVNWTMPKVYGAWIFPAVSAALALYNINFKPDTSKGLLWFQGVILLGVNVIALYIAMPR